MNKLIPFFFLSFFSASLSAQTTGQLILQYKNAGAGSAVEGLTLGNGNDLLTVNGAGKLTKEARSSVLSAYLTSATAASTYEPVISAGTTGQYWRGDKSWQTLNATAVGLGSVENTALSTWAGTTNVITLGTVTTGTWNASIIPPAYLGTGSSISTKYLRGDGTWQTLDLSAYQTTGGTLALAGFSSVTGTLDVANGGTGITTFGTGVATALGNNVNASGGLLTYALIGTSGTKVPLLDAANTWSATQTISATLPVLLLQGTDYGGGAVIRVNSTFTPALTFNFNGSASSAIINPAGFVMNGGTFQMSWGAALGFGSDGSMTAYLKRIGNNWLAAANSTAAQRWDVFNTYTSTSNYETCVLDWQTTTNTLRIGSDVGSGGGTARDVQLIRGGVLKATIGANTTDHAQPVKLPSYTVAGLPSAATCGAGAMAFVTDANATTAYSVVVGGGSNKVLVISDGADWIVH